MGLGTRKAPESGTLTLGAVWPCWVSGSSAEKNRPLAYLP